MTAATNPPQPNKTEPPEDIEKLRQAVLQWIEAKPPKPAKPKTKTKEKNKTAIPKIQPTPPPPKLEGSVRRVWRPLNRAAAPRHLGRLIVWLVITTITSLVIFGFALYTFAWDSPVITAVTRWIPYPAAVVNYQPIAYYQWQQQTNTLMNFYQREKNRDPEIIIPASAETQQHVLNRMIEQTLLQQLARQYNVSLTEEEIIQQLQSLAEEIGGQAALENQLVQIYGWQVADFRREILEPLMLKNKLQTAINFDDRVNQEAKATAEAVRRQVEAEPENFAVLAQQYSQDSSAAQGGDLGYILPGQTVPPFETATFQLQPGEISSVVKTQFGYHVIKAEEVKTDQTGLVTEVRARHILIRSISLETYLQKLRAEASIWQFVSI